VERFQQRERLLTEARGPALVDALSD